MMDSWKRVVSYIFLFFHIVIITGRERPAVREPKVAPTIFTFTNISRRGRKWFSKIKKEKEHPWMTWRRHGFKILCCAHHSCDFLPSCSALLKRPCYLLNPARRTRIGQDQIRALCVPCYMRSRRCYSSPRLLSSKRQRGKGFPGATMCPFRSRVYVIARFLRQGVPAARINGPPRAYGGPGPRRQSFVISPEITCERGV